MKKAALLPILVVAYLMALVLALAPSAEAQQPKKVPRIGYLSSVDPAGESARAEGIRLALRERGYIEGQNIATEYRYAEGKQNRYPELVGPAWLKALRVPAATSPAVLAQDGSITLPRINFRHHNLA